METLKSMEGLLAVNLCKRIFTAKKARTQISVLFSLFQ